jgi:hypothetical protein
LMGRPVIEYIVGYIDKDEDTDTAEYLNRVGKDGWILSTIREIDSYGVYYIFYRPVDD